MVLDPNIKEAQGSNRCQPLGIHMIREQGTNKIHIILILQGLVTSLDPLQQDTNQISIITNPQAKVILVHTLLRLDILPKVVLDINPVLPLVSVDGVLPLDKVMPPNNNSNTHMVKVRV